MITVSQAIKIIDRETGPLGVERVGIADAVGRVLAEDIVADMDLPPFDRSQMDGYAVKAKDTENSPVTLKIVGESAAGRGWKGTLKKGEAVRIMTGAPVPKGADAIQRLEVANEHDGRVTLIEPTSKLRYIVKRGSEVKNGRVVLPKGEMLSAANIAVPAAFGYARLKVARHPRVAILATGTEIVPIEKKPRPDQIRNSNSLMLKALCESAGAKATILPQVGDDPDRLRTQISLALKDADILITTGGVSVGKYDLTKSAMAELGAEIFFDRVRLKPGKPTVFGRLGKTLIFGLPGNPVSAAVTFYLFVRRSLLLMQSAKAVDLARGFAVVEGDVMGTKGRDSYLPARLATAPEGRLSAVPITWHGSSDLVGFSSADVLVIIPAGNAIGRSEACEVLFL